VCNIVLSWTSCVQNSAFFLVDTRTKETYYKKKALFCTQNVLFLWPRLPKRPHILVSLLMKAIIHISKYLYENLYMLIFIYVFFLRIVCVQRQSRKGVSYIYIFWHPFQSPYVSIFSYDNLYMLIWKSLHNHIKSLSAHQIKSRICVCCTRIVSMRCIERWGSSLCVVVRIYTCIYLRVLQQCVAVLQCV